MASSLTISSIVLFFCLSSLFFPAARCGGVDGSAANGLIETACTIVDDAVLIEIPWDYNICVSFLKSIPNAASSPDLLNLAVNLINAAISNVTNTYTYIQNTSKRGRLVPSYMNAIKACESSYARAMGDFKGVLADIKDQRNCKAASYGLYFIRDDDIDICNKALASNKIEDEAISRGNIFAYLFCTAADAVCTHLGNV